MVSDAVTRVTRVTAQQKNRKEGITSSVIPKSTFQNKPASNKESYQRSRTHKQHGTEKKNTGGNKSFSPSPN